MYADPVKSLNLQGGLCPALDQPNFPGESLFFCSQSSCSSSTSRASCSSLSSSLLPWPSSLRPPSVVLRSCACLVSQRLRSSAPSPSPSCAESATSSLVNC